MSDGARTRDNRDHNPVLYQLSYTHHGAATSIAARQAGSGVPPTSEAASAMACSEFGPGCGTNIAAR